MINVISKAFLSAYPDRKSFLKAFPGMTTLMAQNILFAFEPDRISELLNHYVKQLPSHDQEKGIQFLTSGDHISETGAFIILAHAMGQEKRSMLHHYASRICLEDTEKVDKATQDIHTQFLEEGYHQCGYLDTGHSWKQVMIYSNGDDIISETQFQDRIKKAETGTPSQKAAKFVTLYDLSETKLSKENKQVLMALINGSDVEENALWQILDTETLPDEIKALALLKKNDATNHFALLTDNLEHSMAILKAVGESPNSLQDGGDRGTMKQQSNFCKNLYIEFVTLYKRDPTVLNPVDIKKEKESQGHDVSYLISGGVSEASSYIALTNFKYQNAKALFRSTVKNVYEEYLALSTKLGNTPSSVMVEKIKDLNKELPRDNLVRE
ncbi:MAG: hypothetical protein HRT90_09750 [Candidatus Margulisbacteria bacterium]|nr:hypothetical protein [Candidatus Margulisiibacteriota bacterium]